MKLVVILSLLIIFLFPSTYKHNFTISLSVIWFCYSIYFFIKSYNLKDKKIITNKYLMYSPNHSDSACVRYLYNKRIDYKVFVATIIELFIKKSILFRKLSNGDYVIVDNKDSNEVLSKSESYVKKILFKDIGNSEEVSLANIKNKCIRNSGYIFSVYREWQNIFEFQCVSNKYFISNKNIVDKSLLYFGCSFIISLYNIIFTNYIIVAIIILCITGYLCSFVNNINNLEDDAKEEYKKWLEFKNYIDKDDNNLYELDNSTLENYATYAYVLDSYDNFVKVLNKKRNNKNCFYDSELLELMCIGDFVYIENIIKKSINIIDFKTKVLFSKNKGRR